MPYEMILTERHGHVGLITINRPQAMNALNNLLMRELMDALEAFDKNENVGAMVIAGNEKAFAAAADIKEMAGKSSLQRMATGPEAAFWRTRSIQKPALAAAFGWALRGADGVPESSEMVSPC